MRQVRFGGWVVRYDPKNMENEWDYKNGGYTGKSFIVPFVFNSDVDGMAMTLEQMEEFIKDLQELVSEVKNVR